MTGIEVTDYVFLIKSNYSEFKKYIYFVYQVVQVLYIEINKIITYLN